MPFNFCVIKIPFPFALILLPCAKSQVALLKCPWGFPRPTALLSRPSDVGWELARPGPGSELSCCFDTLPPPSLSCLLPAVVIFLIRVMAFKSWFINKVLVSLIVDYFLFEWEKALVLAYLDEEPNLERICIEIAGFRKLLSDGKWSNFLVSPHYGYLANPPRQINGRALNSFIREMRGWESRREKWGKLLESPSVYCQARGQVQSPSLKSLKSEICSKRERGIGMRAVTKILYNLHNLSYPILGLDSIKMDDIYHITNPSAPFGRPSDASRRSWASSWRGNQTTLYSLDTRPEYPWVPGRCPKSFQVDSARKSRVGGTMFKQNIIKDTFKESEWW